MKNKETNDNAFKKKNLSNSPEKVGLKSCKFCGLETFEIDDLIGVCDFCLNEVIRKEKEYEKQF